MKILKLRFENLNSLNAKWEIDFTHPEYEFNGIFAITGPTGAGKSTILDAICLALYGRTPRLATISASTNEIMSRRTGECYAEVEFETKSGHYRVSWSQKKSRGKIDGALQQSKHILYDDSGSTLEDKKREVANKIEELTGLDYDRFTRSMLLAQGGFDVFLQAPPDKRAPILEEITGTGIYSQISMMVHEIKRDKDQVLNILNAELTGIELLDEEAEKELNSELKEKSEVETKLKKTDNALTGKITWLTEIDKLRDEQKTLVDESKVIEAEQSAFKPQKEVLNKALNAAKIDADYALLREKRDNLKKDLKAFSENSKQLPELEKQFKSSEKNNSAKFAELEKNKILQIKEFETLKVVRKFDIQIAEQNKAHSKILNKKAVLNQELENEKKKLVLLQENLKKTQAEQEKLEKYLKDNKNDEKLQSELKVLEERLNNLRTSQKQIADCQLKIKKLQKDAANESANIANENTKKQTLEANLNVVQENIKLEKQKLEKMLAGRLLRELRIEKESKLKEHGLVSKIVSLEEERKQLEDNKPCPLCGATHHPYALGNVPELSTLEHEIREIEKIIVEVEKLEHCISEKEKSANSAKQKLAKQEGEKKLFEQRLETATQAIKEETVNLDQLSAKFAEDKKIISAEIATFGYDENALKNTEQILTQLSERLQKWISTGKLFHELKNSIIKINSDLSGLNNLLQQRNKDISTIIEEEKKIQEILSELQLKRKELYGEKNPDLEEQRMAETLTGMEKSAKFAKSELEQLRLKLKELNTTANKLKEDIENAEPVLEKLETKFANSRNEQGFENEKTFLVALLKQDELDKLAELAKDFELKSADIASRIKVNMEKFRIEEEKKLTDEALEKLNEQKLELDKTLGELRETVGAVRQKLNDNNLAKQKTKDSEIAIKKAEADAFDWGLLHTLIGSGDGKKFRNFAQGLTFQIMVMYANRQLKTMTDRYLLVRDKNSPLELNVIDNYQAGEERSTKNLSGGESFIVSLALALGLSNMASRNVSVDSLFLDEGFGTLDEDSLEMALESLATLQQENKLIGIISHVGALKERITTQINVSPLTGGKSEISGPGCIKQ